MSCSALPVKAAAAAGSVRSNRLRCSPFLIPLFIALGTYMYLIIDSMHVFTTLWAGKPICESSLMYVIPAEVPFLSRAEVYVAGYLFSALCAFVGHVRLSSLRFTWKLN